MTPSNLTIRRLTPDDSGIAAAFIRQMVEEMGTYSELHNTDDEESWQRFQGFVADRIKDENTISMVAEAPDLSPEPVGFLEVNLLKMPEIFKTVPYLHVSAVVVPKPYRRQGIAERLLREALTIGKTHGCQFAELDVLATIPAQHLYRKLGFEVFHHNMRMSLTEMETKDDGSSKP